MVDQIRFDQSMNKSRVMIENAFGTLKNQWRILKKFNACVDWTHMNTLACCTLHNFCQLQGMLEPIVHDVWRQGDPFVGFVGMHISVPQEGEKTKATTEEMWDALFKSWI
jgi:hypothetical protein